MPSLLCYRAGPRALQRLRDGGFSLGDISTLVLPATGPKWLVTAGIDRVLAQDAAWCEGAGRRLVLGASAGGWRALALCAKAPARAQAALLERYCAQHFTRADTPRVISAAYAALLSDVFSEGDLAHALAHPTRILALIVARMRGSRGTRPARPTQMLHVGGAALLSLVHRSGPHAVFERMVFHAQPQHGSAVLSGLGAAVRTAPLTQQNIRDMALATGSVPLYMEPVCHPASAPAGAYLDGGLTDYHLALPLRAEPGVALLVSHQSRVIPGWFDKLLPWRRASQILQNVVVVHPAPEFLARLPGGRVPTRDDFVEFLHDPAERRRRWLAVAAASEKLGEALREDVASGAIARNCEPLR